MCECKLMSKVKDQHYNWYYRSCTMYTIYVQCSAYDYYRTIITVASAWY